MKRVLTLLSAIGRGLSTIYPGTRAAEAAVAARTGSGRVMTAYHSLGGSGLGFHITPHHCLMAINGHQWVLKLPEWHLMINSTFSLQVKSKPMAIH